MKKAGILGGTFDPIHNGHMAMAERAIEQLGLDEMILLPAGNPYFKKGITPYEERYEMCKRAARESRYAQKMSVSRLEADESKPTYTYVTLGAVKESDPETELYFLCGADVLQSIDSWRNPEGIFAVAKLAVFERDGSESVRRSALALKEKYRDADCVFISGDVPDISSTMVRECVKKGESIEGLVSTAVREFIEGRRFYQDSSLRSE